MGAPWPAVPLPDGSPAPSGMMLVSHAAISSGATCLPRLGPPAGALGHAASASTTAKPAKLRVNMFDLPLAVDCPTRDAVVMLVGKNGNRRYRFQLAAMGHEFGTGRLCVAAFVPRAAL